MLFDELARVSVAVAATSKRNEKVALLADTLRTLAPDEVEPRCRLPRRNHTDGRIGVGWATLSSVTRVAGRASQR